MPIDASIYGQIHAPHLNTPAETLQAKVETQALAAKQRELAQAARAQQEIPSILQASARADGTPDYDRAIATLMTRGYLPQAQAMQKALDEHRKAAGEIGRAHV